MATQAEFAKWWADFATYFPDARSYFNNLPQDDRPKTMQGWYRTLAPFSQVVLGTVTDFMLDNKIDALESNEYGLFAIRIRAYAARISDDLAKRQKRGDDPEKFSGIAASLTHTSAELLAHSRAAVRVCRAQDFREGWLDEVNLAAVILADDPTDAERASSLAKFAEFGLSEEQLRPQAEDYAREILPELGD